MNRNSERKRLDISVMAFVELLVRNPDIPYYMVFVTTARVELGATYDIQGMYIHELKRRGLEVEKYMQRCVIVDNGPPNLITDEAINQIYNACDVGLNSSNGEGFGLCQLEHLATGAPQVVIDVGDYRAFMDEEVAVFVKPSQITYLPARFGMGMYAESCTPSEFADAMVKALELEKSKCTKKTEKRAWSRICDPFLELVTETYQKK